MNLTIVLLAAGAGRRFKQSVTAESSSHKLLQLVRGKSLLMRAIEVAQSLHKKIHLVVGADTEQLILHLREHNKLDSVELVENANWQTGLASSIKSGIESLRSDVDAVLILLADQVAIQASDLKKIIDIYELNEAKQPIIGARYENRLGVPAIFPRKYFNKLRQLSGDKGAKEILESCEAIQVDMPTASIDIDTAKDLENFLKALVR